MTALLEERDRLHETTEETDATEIGAMVTNMMDMMETDALTIHLVPSNDLWRQPPSAQR